jgi:hypothetical protein
VQKTARSVGLATSVLHCVRAGVVATQGDDDLASAINDNGGDRVTIGLAAVARRFHDRLGDHMRKVAVSDNLGVSILLKARRGEFLHSIKKKGRKGRSCPGFPLRPPL